MAVLADRTLTATDGAGGVASPPVRPTWPAGKVAGYGFTVIVTGGPATLDARGAVEISLDGINWQQVARFVDITSTSGGNRITKIHSTDTASAGAAASAAALDTANAASEVLTDWIGYYVRARTKLHALTGGTDPTVRILVTSID